MVIPPGVLSYNDPGDYLITSNNFIPNCSFVNGTDNWSVWSVGTSNPSISVVTSAGSLFTTTPVEGGNILYMQTTSNTGGHNQGIEQTVPIPDEFQGVTNRYCDYEMAYFCDGSPNDEIYRVTVTPINSTGTELTNINNFNPPRAAQATQGQTWGGGWRNCRNFYMAVPDSAVSLKFRFDIVGNGGVSPDVYIDRVCARMYSDATPLSQLSKGPRDLYDFSTTQSQYEDRKLQHLGNITQGHWTAGGSQSFTHVEGWVDDTPLFPIRWPLGTINRFTNGAFGIEYPLPAYHRRRIADGITVEVSHNVDIFCLGRDSHFFRACEGLLYSIDSSGTKTLLDSISFNPADVAATGSQIITLSYNIFNTAIPSDAVAVAAYMERNGFAQGNFGIRDFGLQIDA